jgi:hypothetical protein
MRKILKATAGIMLIFGFVTSAFASSYELRYKLEPGQRWILRMLSQSKITLMGKKDVFETKTIIEYRVTEGPKKGWVSLVARIKSKKHNIGESIADYIDLTRFKFKADMHFSGEIRNVHWEEEKPIAEEGNMESLSPEMVRMMQQSANFMVEMWKGAVFWFPELPEDRLELGDEFEVTKKRSAGSEGAPGQIQTLIKQVFTLEDVDDGLAYFSVKERSIAKTKVAMAGKSEDIKVLSKGRAIFDLKEGMWTEFVIKSRFKEVLSIFKYEMERQEPDFEPAVPPKELLEGK